MTKMHQTGVSPELIEFMKKRRGAVHVYDSFDPAKTALIAVDMQNAWLMEGQPAYLECGPGIIPNVNRLADALRGVGSLVLWLRNMHSEAKIETWSNFFDFFGPNRRERMVAALTEGNIGSALHADLDIRPEDEIVEKMHYSAFTRGSSDLEQKLRARGIDTVIICGVATNVCCESSARDAHMLNFKTVVVSDGNATGSDLLHTGALNGLFAMFADVMTSNEVLARLETSTAHAAQHAAQ